MKDITIGLVIEKAGSHKLRIAINREATEYELTIEQLVLLMYQITAAIWSYYRLVPRD